MPDDVKAKKRRDTQGSNREWGAAYAAWLEGSQSAFGHWMQTLFALSQEMTQFTQARLQEDVAAWSALTACRSPEEAIECQRRFAAKATEQYAEEIGRISQRMASLMKEGLAPRPPLA